MAIDSAGVLAEMQIDGADVLEVNIQGDESATYQLFISPTGTNWYPSTEYPSTTTVDDVRDTAARFVRLEVTTAAATAGMTANFYLGAN